MNEEIDTFSHTHIICPYCGAVVKEVDFETFYGSDIECEEEFYCDKCEHDFVASRSVIWCYESYKKQVKSL